MTFRKVALAISCCGLETPAFVRENSGDFGADYGVRLDVGLRVYRIAWRFVHASQLYLSTPAQIDHSMARDAR